MTVEEQLQWLVENEGQATFFHSRQEGTQVWIGTSGWGWVLGSGATLEEAIQDAQKYIDRLTASGLYPMEQDRSEQWEE